VRILVGDRDAVVVPVVGRCRRLIERVGDLCQPLAQIVLILGRIAVAVDDLDRVALAVIDGFRDLAKAVGLFGPIGSAVVLVRSRKALPLV
jgi:hypothetical protein